MYSEKVGIRMRKLRVMANISKELLSQYLGINIETLEDIESGNVDELNFGIVLKLSDLYCCSEMLILEGQHSKFMKFKKPILSVEVLVKIARHNKSRRERASSEDLDRFYKSKSSSEEIIVPEIADCRLQEFYKNIEKQSSEDDVDEMSEEEEHKQREFEETVLNEYYYNDYNPFGL